MNILITGAGGFLGSALARKLGSLDHHVSLLIRKSTKLDRLTDLSTYKIGRCEADQEITQFISDVSPDVVIHTACCYGRGSESTIQVIDSNIRFGVLILNAINGLEKKVSFINAGTVLSRDVSFYALTKIQFEELGAYISNLSNHNIQFINIKLQHMYGPGDDASKFTSYVINACKNNLPTLPLTPGDQKRDFIYIDDVVAAFILILEEVDSLDNEFIEFEVGSGRAVSIKDFVELVHYLAQSRTHLEFGAIPYRKDEVMFSEASIESLKKLGWTSKTSLIDGLKLTMKKS